MNHGGQPHHRRPVYRESKQEKAVKVYTINQESRYILVKGVPKISDITEVVVKRFSLYGAIQEYRILEDYPDTEKFTAVYWIKYVKIQSARVAKRKMNGQSFFGGFLKVIYAPEYEDVEDTRQKLVGRRKDVAWRLRHLDKAAETDIQDGSKADKISDSEVADPGQLTVDHANSSSSSLPTERGSIPGQSNVGEIGTKPLFPALPPPPSSSPCENPPNIKPCVASVQATLPNDFNPYVNESYLGANLDDAPNSIPRSRGTSSLQSRSSQAASNMRGGSHPRSNRSTTNDQNVHSPRTSLPSGLGCIRTELNAVSSSNEGSESFFQRTRPPDREIPKSSPWVVTGRRELDKQQQGQKRNLDVTSRGGARPKAIPRRRFAWANEGGTASHAPGSSSSEQRFLGQRQNPAPLPASNPAGMVGTMAPGQMQVVPRQVRQGHKRRAEMDNTAEEGLSNPEPSSFDQSVLSIRERMRQVHHPPASGSQVSLPPSRAAHPSQLSVPSGGSQSESSSNSQSSNHPSLPSGSNTTNQASTHTQRRADPNKRRRI